MDKHKANLTAIAEAIREKEGSTQPIVASEFPERIRGIGALKEASMTQQAVYKATRPKDWPVMPEPADNELYLLFAIPDKVSAVLFFQVTCTGGTYTVETGNAEDGVFARVGEPVTLESGAVYGGELFADDYTALASDGCKMALIKISGAELLTWRTVKSATVTTGVSYWPILEICGRMSAATLVYCENLMTLRYFTLVGPNQITNMDKMFKNCTNFVCLPELDTSKATTMSQMFYGCNSLALYPVLDMSSYAAPITATSNFAGVRTIVGIRTPLAPNTLTATFGAKFLERVEFDPTLEGWTGQNLRVQSDTMGHAALVRLFESLPTITENHSIDVIHSRGAAELTEEEIAIAAAKNWTVVKEATT